MPTPTAALGLQLPYAPFLASPTGGGGGGALGETNSQIKEETKIQGGAADKSGLVRGPRVPDTGGLGRMWSQQKTSSWDRKSRFSDPVPQFRPPRNNLSPFARRFTSEAGLCSGTLGGKGGGPLGSPAPPARRPRGRLLKNGWVQGGPDHGSSRGLDLSRASPGPSST